MKKIFLIISVLVSVMSYGQVPNFVERSGPAVTAQDYRSAAKYNFYQPHIRGFNPSNGFGLNGGVDTLGAIVYDDSSHHEWYRDTILGVGHKWSMVLTFGDAGTVTSISMGLGLLPGTITSTGTINNDTSFFAGLFPRRKDSTFAFVTPTQMNSQGFLKTISGISAGGVLNGTYPNPGLVSNVVQYSNIQQIPAFSFIANPTASSANSQASYFGYGLRWNNDTVKVDTSLLKIIFGSASGSFITGAGNFSPLFNTSVSSNQIVFSPINAPAGSVFGNNGGSSAPAAFFVPNAAMVNGWLTYTAQPSLISRGIGYRMFDPSSNGIKSLNCVGCTLDSTISGEITIIVSGGGGGGTNLNVGSGYRWAIPTTNNVKTFFVVNGTLDSTTNANALTLTIPTYQSNLSNTGSGFRVFTPGSSIKSLVCSGCTIDSTTNVGSLTFTVTGGGSGTVTSVGQTVPTSLLTISGSPVTTNGTLAIGLASAESSSVWGDSTGTAGIPGYYRPTQSLLNTWYGGTIQSQLSNSGTGYRWFVSGSSIRSLVCSGCTLDSTTNSGSLTLTVTGGGSGTVTTFGITGANGFAGTVSNPTTTPNLTLTTTVNGLVYGNGTSLAAATISSPLTYSAGTVGIQAGGASQNGYISSTDWNTFNGKQSALSNTPSGGFPLFNLNASAIRELFSGTNVTIDSTTNPGGYTINAIGGGGSIDTNSHHITALLTQNQSTYRFTITRFGAIRDSTVDNTSAIQMAIDSCSYYGGGTVYVPAGVWLVKQLRLDNRQNVIVMGEGRASVFKADSACAMILGYNTNFPGVNASIRGTGGIRNIALRGHGLATYGMQLYYNYWFSMPGISIDSCTTMGIQLKGTLTGEFSDLTIEHCPIGVMADTVNLSPGGPVASNLIKFNNIRLYYCSTWGLWCNKTEINIEVDNGDFEYNGTVHNQATGAINITNSNGSGLARFQNCDFEQNLGDVISLTGNTGAVSYEFIHCNVLINGSASIGLNSNPLIALQNILLDGTYIKNDSLDVYTTGNTKITELNGGTYGTDNNSAGTRWYYTKNLSYNGTTDHLISSATGTVVLLKNGAGSGATISLSSVSTDVSGIITITTGSSPLPSDTLCYIIQSSSQWVTTGIVTILSPANAAAKSLAGDAQVWAPGNSSPPYYSYILTGIDALLPSTTYEWTYINSGR